MLMNANEQRACRITVARQKADMEMDFQLLGTEKTAELENCNLKLSDFNEKASFSQRKVEMNQQ